MKALVIKDFYLLLSMGKTYLLLIGLFVILTLAGVYNTSFASALVVLLMIMMPINTFAYDELAKWDQYAVSTPAGRRGVVGGKYLFALILMGLCLALGLVLNLLLFLMGRMEGQSLPEALAPISSSLGAGVLLNAVLLPLIFRFGTQKSRVALMLLVGAVTALVVVFLGILSPPEVSLSAVASVLLFLPLIALAGLAVSYRVSLAIYAKKEL